MPDLPIDEKETNLINEIKQIRLILAQIQAKQDKMEDKQDKMEKNVGPNTRESETIQSCSRPLTSLSGKTRRIDSKISQAVWKLSQSHLCQLDFQNLQPDI